MGRLIILYYNSRDRYYYTYNIPFDCYYYSSVRDVDDSANSGSGPSHEWL